MKNVVNKVEHCFGLVVKYCLLVVLGLLLTSCGGVGTVLVTVAGDGTVEGSTADQKIIDCSQLCNFTQDVTITLIAKPKTGARFIEWRGAAAEICGTDPVCLLNKPRENVTHIIAIFSTASKNDVATLGNSLFVNGTLRPNGYITSIDGHYRFYFQSDGNLVLRDTRSGKALWASNTNGRGGSSLILYPDGNLVLWDALGRGLWSTATIGTQATRLTVNNSGRLALYKGSAVARVIYE